MSGVALPYTERKVNVDIKCQTVSTTHKLFAYIPRTTAYYMYYKSMPLVFTPVTDPIWLLCIGVRRAKSGPISSAIYLRAVFMQLLGASAAKVILDALALACDVTFNNMPSCSIASL